jgi:hypothetical protein
MAAKPRTFFQTLTFKGLAIVAATATVFPYVSKPVENILVDIFPKNKVLIVNGLSILATGLTFVGLGVAGKGRIDVGDIVTPKYVYGPDSLEPVAEAKLPEQGA